MITYTGTVVPDWAKRVYWGVYSQTPAGRRERRTLTHPDVQAAFRDSAFIAALEEIRAVLGSGPCSQCKCEGCAWEFQEAARLASEAIAASEEHS